MWKQSARIDGQRHTKNVINISRSKHISHTPALNFSGHPAKKHSTHTHRLPHLADNTLGDYSVFPKHTNFNFCQLLFRRLLVIFYNTLFVSVPYIGLSANYYYYHFFPIYLSPFSHSNKLSHPTTPKWNQQPFPNLALQANPNTSPHPPFHTKI